MRLRTASLALIAGLVAAGSAHADFKRSYAQGVDAYSAGKFDDAEKLMKEALADEATPQAKVKLYGMRFEPYVPQFYLGMMAYKRGDCAGAVRYWDTPGVSAIVNSDGALSGPAVSGERECKTKLASSGSSTTTVASTATTEPPKPPVPSSGTSSTNPSTVEPTTVASNTRPTTVAPPPPPPPKPPTPTPTPTTAAEAPADLVSALDNFLLGRYDRAASVDPGRISDAKARYHALLVRAAARHVQSQLQGDAGAALLAQAQSDVRAAKALQPGAAPDASVFSPRFRQFYAATR